MTVSKSWTRDTYDSERREMYRENYNRAFGKKKDKKEKQVKKTRREQITEDLNGAWLKHLNNKSEGNFLDIVVEYIIKNN